MIQLYKNFYFAPDRFRYRVFEQFEFKNSIAQLRPKYYATLETAVTQTADLIARLEAEANEISTLNEFLDTYSQIKNEIISSVKLN